MEAKKIIAGLAIVLAIAHQDFWNWDSAHLIFGFMPVGLFYHACYSLAAVVLWCLTIKFAWPSKIEAWADAEDDK